MTRRGQEAVPGVTRRVVVNTAIYLHRTSGTATATRALVEAMRGLSGVEVLEGAPAVRGRHGSVRNAVKDARWDLWLASRAHRDVDLLVSPCNIGRRGPARKHLLVVLDAMVWDHPEHFDRRFASYWRALVPASIRSADLVLTLSEHARQEILRRFPRVDVRVVALPYAGPPGRPATWPDRPVVLMVGATEPVKNHVAGLHAVAAVRRSSGVDVGVRLIGPAGREEQAVRAVMSRLDPDGRWTSRHVDVAAEALAAAYASSWLLLQPSLDEGYGLPLVEAAQHGLPAVHSGRGAMPTLLPAADAGTVTAPGLAAAMAPLLDRATWAAAAAESARQAPRFAPELFRATIHGLVGELLG